jgi:single-strand DNA-binding protein
MLELNKVLITGRLTRDPDYRSTPSGRAVAKLGVAVNRRWFNRESGGQQEDTTFIDVEVWERTAEFCKNYLHKGSAVFVEGRLKQDTWQDKDSGANRSKIVVVGERVQFAESRAEAERQGGGPTSGPTGGPTSGPTGGSGGGSGGDDSDGGDDGGRGVEAPAGDSTSDDLPF